MLDKIFRDDKRSTGAQQQPQPVLATVCIIELTVFIVLAA